MTRHATTPPPIELRRRGTGRLLAQAVGRWAVRGLALFGAIVAIYWLTLDFSVVVSPSMAPTLQGTSIDNGDRVLTEKVSGWFRSPGRWEVITFTNDAGEKRMKRIAGLPGESVQMPAAGEMSIDGQPIEIPPLLNGKYLRFGNLIDGKPVACGDGYYVLGDDLKDSDDSRFNGPTPRSHVIGRAWLIVWPLSRVGFVNQ